MEPVELFFDALVDMIRRGPGYVAAFLIGGVGGPIAIFLVRFFARRPLWRRIAGLELERKDLLEQKADLDAELKRVERDRDRAVSVHDELTWQRNRARESNEHLRAANEQLQTQAAREREKQETLSQELEERTETIGELQGQVASLSDQMQRLADFDGKIWETRPEPGIVGFRPLDQRNVPVISCVNLKGGVGKTTITANLGATFARLGSRVLIVDLDYQGSLTSLALSAAEIQDIRDGRLFVDRLLSAEPPDPDLLRLCCKQVSAVEALRILPADEPLVNVENRLMAQWLLNSTAIDVRYLLRPYLHSEMVADRYDLVLVDCPPRLTTACVNALTVSDYVLIPVLLDHTSAEAVPRLIRSLANLRRLICPELRILGVIANRVKWRAGRLIDREARVWESLPGRCKERWGEPVHHFQAVIREHAKFAEAAKGTRLAALDSNIQPMFLDLVEEIRTRIPAHERV